MEKPAVRQGHEHTPCGELPKCCHREILAAGDRGREPQEAIQEHQLDAVQGAWLVLVELGLNLPCTQVAAQTSPLGRAQPLWAAPRLSVAAARFPALALDPCSGPCGLACRAREAREVPGKAAFAFRQGRCSSGYFSGSTALCISPRGGGLVLRLRPVGTCEALC